MLRIDSEVEGLTNADHFGHTYGYHENYCLRVSPRSRCNNR